MAGCWVAPLHLRLLLPHHQVELLRVAVGGSEVREGEGAECSGGFGGGAGGEGRHGGLPSPQWAESREVEERHHLPRLATTSMEQQRNMLEVVFREAVVQVQNVENPSGDHPF